MAIDFPSSPTTNDEYSFGGKVYVYDGEKWAAKQPTALGFDDLANVTITSNSSGELPMWNGTAWVNQTPQELALRKQGRETIWIPAAAFLNAAGSAFIGTFNSVAPMPCTEHDASSNNWWYVTIGMPKSWDEGTISYQVYWGQAAAGTGNCVWRLEAGCWSDDEALANTFNSTNVTDAGGTAGDIYISPESSTITFVNTSATENDLLRITFGRYATDAADTLTPKTYMFGVKLFITTNAVDDT